MLGFKTFRMKPYGLLRAAWEAFAQLWAGDAGCASWRGWRAWPFRPGLVSLLLCFGVSKVLSGRSHLQVATLLAAAPLSQQTAKQRSFSGRRLSFMC